MGRFPFSERCAGPAHHTAPDAALLEAGRSGQDGGDGVLGGPVAVAEGGDQAGVVAGKLAAAVFGAGFGEPGAEVDGVAVDADGLAAWRRGLRGKGEVPGAGRSGRRCGGRGEGVGAGNEAEGGVMCCWPGGRICQVTGWRWSREPTFTPASWVSRISSPTGSGRRESSPASRPPATSARLPARGSPADAARRRALSCCWVRDCLTVCRDVMDPGYGPVFRPWWAGRRALRSRPDHEGVWRDCRR